MGEFRLADLAERIGLPAALLDEIIEFLRREKLVEVRSASQFVKSSFRFIITETGKVRAGELLEICHYAGRAPVTLDAYREIRITSYNVCYTKLLRVADRFGDGRLAVAGGAIDEDRRSGTDRRAEAVDQMVADDDFGKGASA